MIKKIDNYLILSFLKSFLFTFSILFFIFSIQFIFQEISKLIGKGIPNFEIFKILFYLGITTIPIITPLSILLSSIICFGTLGEYYELLAIKSCGISTLRIMFPVLIISTLISIGLFLFSNNILPVQHKKVKNLLFNAINTNPALKFINGEFNNHIPGFVIHIKKIYGKNSDSLQNIFIHKQNNIYKNQTTIIAQYGMLKSFFNKSLLKFELYNGYIYENHIHIFNNKKKIKFISPNKTINFSTLSIYINFSEIFNKTLYSKNMQEYFKFCKYNKLTKIIDSIKQNNKFAFLYPKKQKNKLINIFYNKRNKKINIQNYNQVKNKKKKNNKILLSKIKNIKNIKKQYAKVVIYQQHIITFSVMCIIFSLIGSSLGSIIQKGGLGIPVIIAILIFIIWFLMFTFSESESKLGNLNPYIAAWLPNLILFIVSFFLTKQAIEDYKVFDI